MMKGFNLVAKLQEAFKIKGEASHPVVIHDEQGNQMLAVTDVVYNPDGPFKFILLTEPISEQEGT